MAARSQAIEAHWAFACQALAPARRWLRGQLDEGRAIRLGAAHELIETYFDTADWMFRRAGFCLLIRERRISEAAGSIESSFRCEARLVFLAPQVDGPNPTSVLTEPLAGSSADALIAAHGSIGERVRALLGNRLLCVLFVMRSSEESYALSLEPASADVAPRNEAQLSLIDTRIDASSGDGGADPAQLRYRFEISCDAAKRDALRPELAELERELNLQPPMRSQYEIGLAAAGLVPPAAIDLGPTDVLPSMSLREIALAVCRARLAALIGHEPETRRGDDPEALHEMRVAARRLDAAIRLFEEHLPKWTVQSRGTLRSLIRALGATRDLDVQLEYLRDFAAQLTPAEQAALAPLRARLELDRRLARARMLKILDSPRLAQWMKRWVQHVRAARGGSSAGSPTPESFALAAIRRRHKRVRKAAERLSATARPEDFHEVRTRAKRLRYAIDAFAPIYGEPAEKFLRGLVRLQNVLGDYQDADVRTAQLTALANSHKRRLPGETLFLMGRIAERDARVARKVRRRVSKTCRRIRGHRWKTLQRVMTALAEHRLLALAAPDAQRVSELSGAEGNKASTGSLVSAPAAQAQSGLSGP
jgi:CHAD domain-containing protein